jgi:hypothetical protein
MLTMAAKYTLHKCFLIGAILYLTVAGTLGDDLGITEKELRLDIVTIYVKHSNISTIEDPQIPFFETNDLIQVRSTKPWLVIVKDIDPATKGHFTEWNGTSYLSRKLEYPLNVSASREVTLPEGGIIYNGPATTATGNSFNVIFKQRTSWMDQPLQEGSTYRIVVTIKANPLI